MKKFIFGFLLTLSLLALPKIVFAKTTNVNDYDNLKSTIEQAEDGDIIILDNNITMNSYITVNKNITIDLNNNTLTGPNHYTLLAYNDLVIKNGEILVPYAGIYSYSGTTTLENLKVTGSDSLILVNQNGKIIIDKNSVITATGNTNYPAIQITGSYNETEKYNPYLYIYGTVNAGNETAILGNGKDKNISHIYVYDGANITSNKLVFYLPQPCDVNIIGGNITGNSVFGIKSGNINIYGGNITANGNSDDDLKTATNGIYTNGALMHIDSNGGYVGNVSVNISGSAILKSINKNVIKEVGLDSEQTSVVNINVTGGTLLSNENYAPIDVREITKDKVKISGGTFNALIDENLLEANYIQNDNHNGTYTVALPIQQVEIPTINEGQVIEEVTVGIIDDNVENTLMDSLNSSQIDTASKNITVQVSIENSIIPQSNIKDQIENFALNNKLIIPSYFDINIFVKNTDTNETIDTLKELNNKIKLMVLLPKSLKEVPKGYIRAYYIIREHNGKIELLDATLSEDGNSITFESDKFSTYSLAYKDIENINEIENPQTYDGIMLEIIIGISSLIGLLFSILYIKKKNFN